jgi:opacity protein-like surface antigen
MGHQEKKMQLSKFLLLLGLAPFCADAFGDTASFATYGTVPVRVDLNRYTVIQMPPDAAEKAKWYAGASLFYNRAVFESKHLTNGVYDSSDPYSKDKFSIGQLGGGLSFGQKFSQNWRLEGEAGWFGKYSEQENGAEFSIHTPYVLANVLYDMDVRAWGGFYFGAGIGMAFPTTSLESWRFFDGDQKKTSVSPMGALMVGYQYPIYERFWLDVKYRLSGFNGTKHTRPWMATSNVVYDFTNKTGFILNNTLFVGVRYDF